MSVFLTTRGAIVASFTRTHVTNGLLPDCGAIRGVQCEQVGVRRYEVDLAVGHRAAAVDVPAAERDIEGRGACSAKAAGPFASRAQNQLPQPVTYMTLPMTSGDALGNA